MTSSAKVRGNPRPHSPLDRLAVVFADPVRLTIVSELFLREMSPSAFAKTYRVGSPSRVARHFSRLEEYAWLRFVRIQPSGGRGRPEKLYRAAQLAIFDEETWALLPPSMREEFSGRIFQQFGERVAEALEAGTFDARPDRHFTWEPLVLDESGRATVLRVLNELFRAVLEEQADARIRTHYSQEPPIHATAGLGAFDSPIGRRRASELLPPAPAPPSPMTLEKNFTVRFARVFNSEVNLKIMTELSLRAMSASQFAEEFGFPYTDICWRFNLLRELGWIELVKEMSGGDRRGGTEGFYRATSPVIADTLCWSQMSRDEQTEGSWRIFTQLAEQVQEAFKARTFDARPDRHLTWIHLELDQLGWEKVIAAARQCFEDVRQEQQNAKLRLGASVAEPALLVAYIAAFESPPPGALPSV